MKKGLLSFSGLEVGSFRILMAAFVLTPFSLRALRYFTKAELLKVAIVGFFGNMFPAYLFATAQMSIPSSLAGMLNSLVPLFTVLIGAIVFAVKIKRMQWLGVIMGLIAALLLISGNVSGVQVNSIWPPLMVVLATVFYAISVNVIYTYLSKRSSVNVSAVALLMASPFPFCYLLYSGFWLKAFSGPSQVESLLYVLLLGVVGTALAVVVFNYLIKHSSAVFSSSVTYLIPVVAIFWGLLDGEQITWIQGAAVVGIFLAIRMIIASK